jgi:hypothetical protein
MRQKHIKFNSNEFHSNHAVLQGQELTVAPPSTSLPIPMQTNSSVHINQTLVAESLSLRATIFDLRRKLAKSEAEMLETKEATILNLRQKLAQSQAEALKIPVLEEVFRTVHAISAIANADGKGPSVDADRALGDSEANTSYWKAQALGMKEALQTVPALTAVSSYDSNCSSIGATVGAEHEDSWDDSVRDSPLASNIHGKDVHLK